MTSSLLNHMIISLSTASEWLHTAPAQEQRASPRVVIPFPTLVRGMTCCGKHFEEETVLENLSAGGSYFTIQAPIEPGRPVFVVVRLATSPLYRAAAPRVAARGLIVRAAAQPTGELGVAVCFTVHRFLSAQAV